MPAGNPFSLSPPRISLSELTARISNTIHTSPDLAGVWVTAELSDVRQNGGHCYMVLIEKNHVGTTIAQLRATVWQSTFRLIQKKFREETGRDIATGMKMLLKGSTNHHSLYGLSFNVIDIDPAYTLGDMERIRREILERLYKEGLLNLNKSLTFPVAPQRIAIVSAEGAAGYGDFMNHLLLNNRGFVFYPVLFPSVMQGERVSISVRQALSKIEKTKENWDCVVIIRGGGATTDLNGFDDYDLARAVATFPLPVIVGIGHERDRTVLDEIANTRMMTPTAVASFLVASLERAFGDLSAICDKITRWITDRLAGEEIRLSNLTATLPALVNSKISEQKNRLEAMARGIPVVTSSRIAHENTRINSMGSILSTLSRNLISLQQRKLSEKQNLLELSLKNLLRIQKEKLSRLNDITELLSPTKTLKRGYSITRIDGKALTSTKGIKKGMKITTTLVDGDIESEVVE